MVEAERISFFLVEDNVSYASRPLVFGSIPHPALSRAAVLSVPPSGAEVDSAEEKESPSTGKPSVQHSASAVFNPLTRTQQLSRSSSSSSFFNTSRVYDKELVCKVSKVLGAIAVIYSCTLAPKLGLSHGARFAIASAPL